MVYVISKNGRELTLWFINVNLVKHLGLVTFNLDRMIAVSAIICTHNPRRDYLKRVLNALQAQTLPKDEWELLIIDNASEQALATDWDLSWHPLPRHIREDELGLTPARLRGIAGGEGRTPCFYRR